MSLPSAVLTVSTVSLMKNSGTISTRPPTLIASMVSTSIRPTFRSILSCFMLAPSFVSFRLRSGHGKFARFSCAALADGHRHVVTHEQHAAQDEYSDQCAHLG